MGHQVVVYDQRPKLGGMLRYGIPDYRLPQDKLDADIDFILSTGIEVHTGVSIGRDISFAEIENQYDAVYISIGAHNDKKIGIPGEDAVGVHSAVQLLRDIGEAACQTSRASASASSAAATCRWMQPEPQSVSVPPQ